jgi:N-acetylglutamate synthase-like GNAT family acetyltransferase
MNDTTFALRRGTPADAPALWRIRHDAIREICRSHYPVPMLERWADAPMPPTFPGNIEKDYFVVGTIRGAIAGFAALNTATATIDAVFVSPAHTRAGLGCMLVAHLETVARDAGLAAVGLTATLNAVPFYQAVGFVALEDTTYTTSTCAEIACVRMEKSLRDLRHPPA